MSKTYSSYKKSGIEWIGDIPKGWIVAKIGFFSNVYRGSGYQILNQVDEDYNGRKEKVLRIGDFNSYNPIWCEYKEQFENYRISKDDLLIGGTGHYFGKSLSVTEEMVGLIHSYNIIRLVINKLYSNFVFYWMSSPLIREQIDISVLGAGQPFIDIKGLKDLRILIPPLPEQTQIAKYLDYQTNIIDQLIAKKEKLVTLLQEQRQAIINEAVTKGLDPNAKMKDSGIEWLGEIPEGWTIAKTKHVALNVTDGAHVSPDLSSEDFPFISTVNIGNRGQIDWGNCLRTSSENYYGLVANGCKPKIGDVLYSKDGTIGKTTIVDFDKEFVVASSLLIIRPNPDLIESEFLNYLFHSNFVKQQIDQLLSGVALRRISITKFSNLEMIIPPLNVQEIIINAIKAKVNSLNSVLDLINDQIINLKEYRQSIISEAVTGKIDLREWKAPKQATA